MKSAITSRLERLSSALGLIWLLSRELTERNSPQSFQDLRWLFSKRRYRKSQLLGIDGTQKLGSADRNGANIAYVIHLHYQEYLTLLLERLDLFQLNPSWSLYVSTSNDSIFRTVQKAMSDKGIRGRVVRVPNRGRNFAPFLHEFAKDIVQNEFVFHLHSKKSAHLSARKARDWGLDSWKLLLLEEKLVDMTISIFRERESVGLVYSETRDLLRNINLTWGRNFSHLEKWSQELNLKTPVSKFRFLDFPAGGMFAARVESIRPLLASSFNYEDFPMEQGQVDGTLQHAIERAIGAIVTSIRFEIASYDFETNGVYLERGFGVKETN